MNNVIGTCSLCQGPVAVPRLWYGIYPPIPHCLSCGAIVKNPHYGPVIDMKPVDRNTVFREKLLQKSDSLEGFFPKLRTITDLKSYKLRIL